LEEEGIENVANFTTADVVDLFLNTKVPPHRIIEWVDQAILLTYLCDDMEGAHAIRNTEFAVIRGYGLRTATNLWLAFKEVSKDGSPFSKLSTLVGDNVMEKLSCVARSIEINPNFALVLAWRGLSPTDG